MPGYELDTVSFTTPFQKEKIGAAETFAQCDHFLHGPIQLRGRDAQVFRVLSQHWLVSCFFRRALLRVVDSFFQHSGESEEWAARPCPEIWRARWDVLSHVRSLANDQ